ncbi:hypothetical protein ACFQ48_08200 [Hymenobacter caeli]|uniref:Uncharacterized protein n=1 Tax=Hymenobacter caeli TaxID=2735894 RepID=A0ABX2FM70_9BACT|nr:hypothetical protein [Hymenobacter caeli]NRT18226.1 hypothetical protein [Hymenobacter caeli]
MHPSFSLLATEPGRQRLVGFALRFAHGTPLAPDLYERQLLAAFVRGSFSLDYLEDRLATRPAPAAQQAIVDGSV